tara:strand:- start:1923 stop:3680 length:1758 start_codon:yes stop_codon:yes gene_type:complete
MEVKCNNLQVFDTATIKKLFVEDLSVPHDTSSDGYRLVETADPKGGTSLVFKPGRSGSEAAKVRALRGGIGIKLNTYDKTIEVKSNIQNSAFSVDAINIFDSDQQSMKQLVAGPGVTFTDSLDHVVISSDERIIPSASGVQLLTGKNLKSLCAGLGVILTEKGDTVEISQKSPVSGYGITVSRTQEGQFVITNNKILRDVKADGVSLLNSDKYFLKRFVFENLDTEESDTHVKITGRVIETHKVIDGVSLISDNKVKYLKQGRNIKLVERGNSVIIEGIKNDTLADFSSICASTTLQIYQDKGKLHFEAPVLETIKSCGDGIELFKSNKVKSIKGKNGIRCIDKGEYVEITSDVCYKNSISTVGSLITGQKVKALVGVDGFKVTSTPDTLLLSFPVVCEGKFFPIGKKKDDALHIRSIRCSGGTKISESDNVLEISSEVVRSAQKPENGLCMLTNAREVKCLLPGNGITIVDKGTFAEIKLDHLLDNFNMIGSNIYEKKMKKFKSIRTISKNLSVYADHNSVVIDDNFNLKSCPGVGGSVVYSDDTLKRIEVDEGLEIIDKGDSLFISSKKILDRLKVIEEKLCV